MNSQFLIIKLLFVVIVITYQYLYPGELNIVWEQFYYTQDYSMDCQGNDIKAQSKGFIITGNAEENVWLLKLDSLGDTVWTKQHYTGDSSRCGGVEIIGTSDGGYVIAGIMFSTIGFGDIRAYVIKTDSNGDLIWEDLYGPSLSINLGLSILETSQQDYIMTGAMANAFGMVKMTCAGDSVWQKTHNSNEYGDATNIHDMGGGNYLVVGSTNLYMENNSKLKRPWLTKINENGDTIWTKTHWYNDYRYYDIAINDGVKISENKYIFVANGNYEVLGVYDVMVLCTDSSGNILWEKKYGGNGDDVGAGIAKTDDGGAVIAGETNSFGTGDYDAWIIKVDSLGDSLWTVIMGGDSADCANSIKQLDDGSYVFTGTNGATADRGEALWVVKFSTSNIRIKYNKGIEYSRGHINISPNPFSKTVQIDISNNGLRTNSGHLGIYSLKGELIYYNNKTSYGAFAWDGRNNNGSFVPSGRYIINLISEEGIIAKNVTYLR